MLDEARLLVERRVPPTLAQRCEDMHAAGGPGPPPPGALPDVLPPAAVATPHTGLLSARMGGPQDRYLPDMPHLHQAASCVPSILGLRSIYVSLDPWATEEASGVVLQSLHVCAL